METRCGILDSVATLRIEITELTNSREYAFPLIPFLLGLEYTTSTKLPGSGSNFFPTLSRRKTAIRLPLVCVGIVTGFLGIGRWEARALLADEQLARLKHLTELLGVAERRAYKRFRVGEEGEGDNSDGM